MLLVFLASLLLITVGCGAFHYAVRFNSLNPGSAAQIPQAISRPYKPMLRLLSQDDLQFVSAAPELKRGLRASRRRIFRAYLRCLSKDYSRLLGGVRWIMVNSAIDRPDLAVLLSRQRREFAVAMCRIEWMLALHAVGFDNVKVDVSGLVGAIDNLTGIVNVFSPVQA
jgi:hypothetical protein